MPTAKSYQNLKIETEPYSMNGRQYVKVRMNNGSLKEVRWYSDAEYANLYQNAVGYPNRTSPYWRPQKHTLGFEKGYITIFSNVDEEYADYMRSIGCNLRSWWGWCLHSDKELAGPLPAGVLSHRLNWTDVSDNDETLFSDSNKIAAAVERAIYGDPTSEFVGKIGDKYEDILTVIKAIPVEGQYGLSTIHVFKDDIDNVFSWTTAAKTLTVNKTYYIKGSIKDHKQYRGVNQTVLTRCKVEEV